MSLATGSVESSKSRLKALVVDDEATSALILKSMLEAHALGVQCVANPSELRASLQQTEFNIIFLDYKLGAINGLDLLPEIVKLCPRAKVIIITAHGSIDLAVQAMHKGASGFVSKPFEYEKITHELERAWSSNKRLKAAVALPTSENGIVGVSPAILRIHEQINRMKDVETTVLIVGESGTGKELVARALHDRSSRGQERFEAVNCAAIPESLLEAELFGHKRGAFTDAKTDRKGLFEVAANGTLFLDEIGEMPLNLQSKLLRVLQDKVVVPLGSSMSIKVNTRVVAATNRNLPTLVKEGRFRRDLYYRLSILQIETSPLRERPEDIGILVEYFIATISEKFSRTVLPPSPAVMARLTSHDWPGNIRELQNSLERAIILSADGSLSIEDIFSRLDTVDSDDDEFSSDPTQFKQLTLAKDDFERRYLERLLTATKGNVSEASKIAGRTRTDMYRLFTKYDINSALFK